MKEKIIFEGQPGESIVECLPKLINKSASLKEDIFLNWNGVTMRITPKDTVNSVLKAYGEESHKQTLVDRESRGEIIDVNDLSKRIASMIQKLLVNN